MVQPKNLIILAGIMALLSCNKPKVATIHNATTKDSLYIEPYPNIHLKAGTLERINDFPSNYVSKRNIDIWIPPKMDSTQKYAVLYMHDGQMLFDRNKTWNQQEWGVDETMYSLLKHNKIPPVIVVGIWNVRKDRHFDYFPEKPFKSLPKNYKNTIEHAYLKGKTRKSLELRADNYLKFIVEELKPAIDENYNTYTTAEHTAIAGSSMGGLISWYAQCEYPEVFGKSASLSTHWIGMGNTSNKKIPEHFFAYLEKNMPTPDKHKFYFDFGDQTLDKDYVQFAPKVDSIFYKAKYDSTNFVNYYFKGAAHDEDAWSSRLYHPLLFLFSKA